MRGETAHLPGGGPAGEICRACDHYRRFSKNAGRCGKAADFLGREPRPISALTLACAHFVRPVRPVEPEPRVLPSRLQRPIGPVYVQAAPGALTTSVKTERRGRYADSEMTRAHALAWVPYLRMCARRDLTLDCHVSSRVLDAVCAALNIEPVDLGLEPGAGG